MENREIARVLSETADLMEITGEDSFRIRSYRNGAAAIEGYAERICDILTDPERKITDVPGIGKGLAAVLQQIAAGGSCEKRDELLLKYPALSNVVHHNSDGLAIRTIHVPMPDLVAIPALDRLPTRDTRLDIVAEDRLVGIGGGERNEDIDRAGAGRLCRDFRLIREGQGARVVLIRGASAESDGH